MKKRTNSTPSITQMAKIKLCEYIKVATPNDDEPNVTSSSFSDILFPPNIIRPKLSYFVK